MTIAFESDAHREAWRTVRDYFEVLGLSTRTLDLEMPTLRLPYTDAPSLTVQVIAYGDDDAIVVFMSYLAKNFKLTLAACKHLLSKNAENLIGTFGIDSDGWLVKSHSILASDLGRESCELFVTVVTDAETADDFIARFGGERHGPWAS